MPNPTQQQNPAVQANIPVMQNIDLTSAEIGTLWNSYIFNSMLKSVYAYFVQRATDPNIRPIIQFALDTATNQYQAIAKIFTTSKQTAPYGFTDADVNPEANLLFSETFILSYARFSARYLLSQFSSALTLSARQDVRDFFNGCIDSAQELYKRTTDMLLQTGLLVRAPYIAVSTEIEFVSKHSFLKGFFGNKRPLNALEIAYLFNNVQTNHVGKTLCIGFAQCAKSQTVKDFMIRGKQIADKHVEQFSNLLKLDDITIPMTWNDVVTDSIDPPFSDKLIMFHVTALVGYSINQYGLALTNSWRTDIVADYSRLMTELLGYAKDGMDIMIENAWLEKVPQCTDREKLMQ